MSSAQRVNIFAAALTDVVQWLEYKTFSRTSWYDRACLLLREASSVAPSLDDLKLAEARNLVRAALKEKVLTAHPPDAFFEELAMPVTPAGVDIFASELDELDAITGKDYAAQSATVEAKWAETDILWRKRAAPQPTAKATARPKPTPKVVPNVAPVSPKVPAKRKDAPPSSDGEEFSPAPARSGTQQVVPSDLFVLTSGRLVVGKTPVPKKTRRHASSRPERVARRSRPTFAVETEDEDTTQDEDDFVDPKPAKKDTGCPVKRSKASKSEKEAFPDEDPEAEPASRAIADVVEQSLANAQVQMTTGLMLARSLLRDGAPGFRGAGVDPEALEDPLDEDLPADFTEDANHPITFRLEATPPVVFDRPSSPSPIPSGPLCLADSAEPYPRASSRHSSDHSSDTGSPKLPSTVIEVDAGGSDGHAEGVEEGGEGSDAEPDQAGVMPGSEA
ncbi:hypothetical protein EUX98_g9636 [Antrodiella citrinella]|uniref:Uncharacterized protein n=1 Tax=Antrodiella citrinella TaxID=2447956 RepID=A0A4S4LV90_9APHY|nr:hypothetical protein EUX98_g9636 [Antrodiella citrinella]